MATWNFDDDDDLTGDDGYTYRPTAFGGSEWNFGNIGDEGLGDSEDAAQSRRASHRPPSPTLSEDNSHSQQQHNTHHQSAARARPSASFLHDLLNPAPQQHHQPSTAATSQRRTESRTHDRPQEHTARPRAPFGYSISALLDSDDEPTPPSNLSDGEFVTLEGSTSESEDSDMPAATRTRNNADRNRRGSAVVDLTAATQATSSQQSRRRKRSADDTDAETGRAPRRRRLSTERFIEEVDLANDEASSAKEELLQRQQRDAIKQQQSEQDDEGPQKIGKRQCIICMESFTNCTATSCGHFYCHECLTQALMTGEKSSDRGIGTCPVCRKPLSRTNRKKMDVIPIQFMKQSQFKKNQGKRGIAT